MPGVADAWSDAAAAASSASGAGAGGGGGGAPLQGALRRARGRLSDALHPGVVSAAEAFAVCAQRRLLAPLPAAAAASVKVVASVHTDLEVGGWAVNGWQMRV